VGYKEPPPLMRMGDEVVRVAERLGFVFDRQRGSHPD
jgi:predicted RNA binding protein YcfA (HicA-like mRNA interferase family)